MDREIRRGLDDWSITEALLTWNGKINTKSVGYKMKKKKKKKKAAMPKTNGWCPLFAGVRYFLPGNNIRPESKEIMIIIVIIIIRQY